ncbi:Retrovirus-related Pol polyprotein from transposon RE2 [Vitis vinifera]|uniref:Retrovirus-related Pol polyprotein from transposon RE2 n=1 Tax=Vitis vinifera TaxID=29760 RepID=A0A438CAJ3_VITVI|nr:Retrovirus-related Pol polyprotein from transposon RE2 [Vitis vinifera]
MNMVRHAKAFWPEAARWTVHVLNRSSTLVVKDKTLEEMWSGVQPKVDYFRVFRCLAHVHVLDQKRTNLDDKSLQCVLLGVSHESKAYRLFDPATRRIIVSRDVSFEEDKGWNWGKTTEEVKHDILVWKDSVEGEDAFFESEEEVVEGAKKIGVKWVFKTKLNEKGEVDKCKSRVVAKGYAQRQGIDYNEVFAPVARWDTIRMVLALAAQKGWSVYQLDIKSVFLHGELKDVYVEQPLGYIRNGEEEKVYKLKKALYGLKQAPRAWYRRIEAYFVKEGFERCDYEHTLFVKEKKKLQESMKDEFDMTDLGKMNENPIVPGFKLSEDREGARIDATLYKQLIGSLMYITATRPDLMYVVCLLSKYMANPTDLHMQAANRVLRYLKGTVELGVFYKRGEDVGELLAYTDNDYAGDIDDRKSTSVKTEESYEESWAKLRSHFPRVNPDCKEKKQRESAMKPILDDSRSSHFWSTF